MKKKYSTNDNIKFMFNLAWNNQKSLIFILIIMAITTAGIDILQLYFTPQIIKMVENSQDFTTIMLTVVVFAVLIFICSATKESLDLRILPKKIYVRTLMLNQCIEKFLSMDYEMTLDKNVLDLSEKANVNLEGNDKATEHIWLTMKDVLYLLISTSVYLILLARLPIFIILVSIIASLISFLYSKKLKQWKYDNRKTQAKFEKEFRYINSVSSHKHAKDIRMFGLGNWLEDIYDSVFVMYDDFMNKMGNKMLMADFLDCVFNLLRNSVTYYYLINFAVNGKIDASMFLLAFSAQTKFGYDVQRLFNFLSVLFMEAKDIATVREFVDLEEKFKKDGGIELNPEEDITIKFENVGYKYPGSDEFVLKNVNFQVNPQEKVAVVGLNGSGKTTLIKLLIGFLDPTEGRVLVNGIDLRELNRRKYYEIFSAVFQDYSILPETIYMNVTQSKSTDDVEGVEEVLKLAGLYDKVKEFPKGVFNTIEKYIYQDSPVLSGGETQKLLLARALYRNSKFLILDEPTAALDPLAERDLYNKYNELTKNHTSIFISHRMASTRFCDYILLIGNKGIEERGTHEELMGKGGTYKYLFDTQAKYYREDYNAKES